jgi:hypothetical protein
LVLVLFGAELLRERQTPNTEIRQAAGVPDELAFALLETFPEDRCVSAASAATDLPHRLDRAGYAGWNVRLGPHVRREGCVTWSVDLAAKTIELVSALAPDAREALTIISNDLMDSCMDKQHAVDHVTSVLRGHGVVDFDVRTDGPLGVPLDRADEVLQHVDAGCWVFSATGWIDGSPVFYVSGK